ncbi:MAG: DEAD/DEAH box helicase [Planctomycetota bacterium]
MRFDDFPLCAPVLRAVLDSGYETPSPIQAKAIPAVLDGRDVLGCAQTGTGKTAAFALPILHNLFANKKAKPTNKPRCLVLAPTRELAGQIAEGFQAYGKHLPVRGAVLFGGVNQNPQVKKLQRGLDVLIATPGRLLDLMNQGYVDLSAIEVLVLDEADRMLDMGFIHDIRKVVAKVPKDHQTLFFSATMPREIKRLADQMLTDPVKIEIAPDKPAAERVRQTAYFVEKQDKPDLFAHVYGKLGMFRVIAFTRTKHGADKLVRQLKQRDIKAQAIHGNKTQNQRQKALDMFKKDRLHVLIATDIAARGIDVDNVTHVINYDLTHEPETHIHRIGRTARAGQGGEALSFCSPDEVGNLRAIQRLLGHEIDVVGDRPDWADKPNVPLNNGQQNKQRGGGGGGRRRSGGKPSSHKTSNHGGGTKSKRTRSKKKKTGKPSAHANANHGQPKPSGNNKPKRRRGKAHPNAKRNKPGGGVK